MTLKPLLDGMITFLPGMAALRTRPTGGTDSARYCYSVWLRHMVMARRNGLDLHPSVVAELGPGDSLGIGLAALLSGCDRYFAFDIVKRASVERNLAIFDELLALFRTRAPIPGQDEWPRVIPRLEEYGFPSDILDDCRLDAALKSSRVERIRNSIPHFQERDSMIQYRVPWYDTSILENECVDMVYSQAVLEHVTDLRNTFRAMYAWLKPSGYISHTIGFASHGTAREWNGHWTYSDLVWKLIVGRRPYLLNREPHSRFMAILQEEGFDVVCDQPTTAMSHLQRNDLAPRFRSIPDDDLVTSEVFILAVKKPLGAQ